MAALYTYAASRNNTWCCTRLARTTASSTGRATSLSRMENCLRSLQSSKSAPPLHERVKQLASACGQCGQRVLGPKNSLQRMRTGSCRTSSHSRKVLFLPSGSGTARVRPVLQVLSLRESQHDILPGSAQVELSEAAGGLCGSSVSIQLWHARVRSSAERCSEQGVERHVPWSTMVVADS